ncbi:MAG: IclR family transcriptional regulator, partial [Bradyrhizobium sp.]|nr:IclR family transcriptional regulator [Bradyrhizobium sp.]
MKPRSKPKTTEKPERLRKADIAKLVAPARDDIDDEAEERQRGGVQSLGRAFTILEEVAR